MSAGTAPRQDSAPAAESIADSRNELRLRIVSASVLAPIALGAVYLGGWVFFGLVTVAAAVMVWEWDRMCGGTNGVTLGLATIVLAAILILAGLAAYLPAILAAMVGSICVWAAARLVGARSSVWKSFGVIYVGVPSVALLVLSARTGDGTVLVFWLLAAVWATDIGAYAAGRSIGGPKLAPKISPNKTWAGLAGGMLSAAAASAAFAAALDWQPFWIWPAAGLVLAVAAQAGDLFESHAKRRFGVKDSSRVIPGHGGVLDRLDGLLAVAPLVAVLTFGLGVS